MYKRQLHTIAIYFLGCFSARRRRKEETILSNPHRKTEKSHIRFEFDGIASSKTIETVRQVCIVFIDRKYHTFTYTCK